MLLAQSNIESMLPLIGAVISASVLGSLHCAGMCGGLMFFALGSDKETSKSSRFKLQSAYHGGRLTTYTMLGVIAGAIGQAIDFGGGFIGLQRGAAVFAGVMMIGFGVVSLARIRGIKVKLISVPTPIRKLVEKAQRSAFGLSPIRRAITIGLLTTLLPCGWLYAFAFVAAGTASPIWGGVTMAVFWMGTLPVMVSLGAGIQFLTGPLHAKLPVITASAVVLVGLMTAMGRLQAPEMSRANLGLADAPTHSFVPTSDEVNCPLCDTPSESHSSDPSLPESDLGAGG
jgi:uncharacterized protein